MPVSPVSSKITLLFWAAISVLKDILNLVHEFQTFASVARFSVIQENSKAFFFLALFQKKHSFEFAYTFFSR